MGVKPAPESKFFANRGPAASISQLDTQSREGDGRLSERPCGPEKQDDVRLEEPYLWVK
jgi:hypothetical protein